LAPWRTKQWRLDIALKFPEKFRLNKHPQYVLACGALACAPTAEVNPQGLAGLDVSDLDLSYDLLEPLTSSSEAFQEFVGQHWDQVFHSAFVYQVQPLDPELEPFVTFAQPTRDGKAMNPQIGTLQTLREKCSDHRMTIGAFATDGDPGYDTIHDVQSKLNVVAFRRNHDISMS
jgi:hypothetical protein